MQILYSLYKLRPVRNQILIVSRQSNQPSIDIRLLEERLHQTMPNYTVKVMCRYSKSAASLDVPYIRYVMGPLMKAFATSKVVVLDGYCIPASMLKHRPQLKIIQMWHAMGCFKKFGFATVGEEGGYTPEFAKMMHMHENYDYVFTSSETCKKAFAEAFHVSEEKMKVMPLPRMDFIRDERYVKECRQRIIETYPQLDDGKAVILYAPTFRKDADNEGFIRDFAKACDLEKYHLVVKPHPIIKGITLGQGIICDYKFQSIEMLSVCDYVVSDYSAFVLEAALANKPIFRYVPDEEEYLQRRGFFTDIRTQWPGCREADADALMQAIEQDRFDLSEVKTFAQKYVQTNVQATKQIASFIQELTVGS
ncbi:MAG: CDP-glycerol glycerophosphotransferase family protein [Eubacterium sp.]|nr:CDP-glycerol glycerophosphotransferase family protein [Eubacterium sp.]